MHKLIVRNRDGANETMDMIGEQFTVLAAGEETGSYEVFVQVVPPGAGPPLHFFGRAIASIPSTPAIWRSYWVCPVDTAFACSNARKISPLG